MKGDTELSLKPCPFCGGEPELASDLGDHSVAIVCSECGFRTKQFRRKTGLMNYKGLQVELLQIDDAVDAWNRRSKEAPTC